MVILEIKITLFTHLLSRGCNTQSCRGGEGLSLASTAATTDKDFTAGRSVSVAATATPVADKSCDRAAAANIKPDGLD